MPFFLYASFPNSRVKPRPSTTIARTFQVTTDIVGNPLTKIVDADANRTYVLLENFSSLNFFYYVYAATSAIDPSVTATYGVPNQLIYFTGTNTLYQKQDTGTTTNWVPVLIQNVGEKVLPLQIASLDSPNEIYAAFDTAGGIIGVDVGAG